MPARLAADGIGTADIALRRVQRVVGALAIAAADRVDRREIEHVETHVLDARQVALHILKCAVPVGVVAHRPGENLIPAGEAGLDAIGIDRHRVRTDGEGARIGGRH
jgi:hypothetical protein